MFPRISVLDYYAWAGLSFELVCMLRTDDIRRTPGVPGVQATVSVRAAGPHVKTRTGRSGRSLVYNVLLIITPMGATV